jgi:hypothetical protein
LAGLGRALYVAIMGTALGALSMVLARRENGRFRAERLCIALAGGLCAWQCLRSIDAHENWSSVTYALVPFGTGMLMYLMGLAFRRFGRPASA